MKTKIKNFLHLKINFDIKILNEFEIRKWTKIFIYTNASYSEYRLNPYYALAHHIMELNNDSLYEIDKFDPRLAKDVVYIPQVWEAIKLTDLECFSNSNYAKYNNFREIANIIRDFYAFVKLLKISNDWVIK